MVPPPGACRRRGFNPEVPHAARSRPCPGWCCVFSNYFTISICSGRWSTIISPATLLSQVAKRQTCGHRKSKCVYMYTYKILSGWVVTMSARGSSHRAPLEINQNSYGFVFTLRKSSWPSTIFASLVKENVSRPQHRDPFACAQVKVPPF